jgi:hypothetical protein
MESARAMLRLDDHRILLSFDAAAGSAAAAADRLAAVRLLALLRSSLDCRCAQRAKAFAHRRHLA